MSPILIAMVGWFVSPIIRSLLPKILAGIGFDASKKLQELEIHIIPELKKTLQAVDQERMMQRGNRVKTDLDALDKMAAMLRHALEDAEDIFDDAQHKVVLGCWHHLCGAFTSCIARCKCCCVWIAHVVHTKSGRLLQWARDISLSLFLLRRPEEPVLVNVGAAVVSAEPVQVTIDIPASAAASDETYPVTTSSEATNDNPDLATTGAQASDDAEASGDEPDPMTTPSDSLSRRWLSCLCSSFDLFKNSCASLYNWWLVHVFQAACFYRDWSYQVVGIRKCPENASLFDILDILLTAISRGELKKRIQKVENTVSEVKSSSLLVLAHESKPNDIANKNRRRLGAANKREVFGREVLRDNIMARLRETPQGDAASSRTSPCYSAIGIYGVAGSGKTTFAGYVRDYIKEECKEEKLFDTIMCIHVSETFSVEVIFQEMLKDITGDSHSNISDHGVLNKKLKEALHGKRFLLILDDLWVKNKNDQQLEELISPLNGRLKGSKILVTARTKEAARALCTDELIEMPDLDEDQYLAMFMHYAGKSIAVKEFEQVGREIAKKLHRSPIAAVTVAGRLGANPNISFWKNVAKLDMLNDTMDALWWSYKQLNPDIMRCFEFCNIFPRRFKLDKHDLVGLWIAQGLVKTSCPTEDMEDVAEGYIQELVSCSFLRPDDYSEECFAIHDLLHDLLAKVAGSDCFRIENTWSHIGEGWKGEVPRDVRHLFVQNYDGELITKKILALENLRTLIIYVVGGTPVEEKVIESICKRLPKLRVLAIAFTKKHFGMRKSNKLSVPKSIAQLKHLRYLAFRTDMLCSITLPRALTKLHNIQLLDFSGGRMLEFPFADLVNLRHMFCWPNLKFPNLGRLISLQTLPCFTVSNEQGYEIRQLRDLNKLQGRLRIKGLQNVKSKEEALEANLAAKERLTELSFEWDDDTRCSSEVEAEVLDGLCPPAGLQKLDIFGYRGSRYPDWMVGKQSGGPEGLRNLFLGGCSQLGPGPEFDAFPHLRVLEIYSCSWDSLLGNMEHLALLKVLHIVGCKNIRSLPTLPQSIEQLYLASCSDELTESCKTAGHPNWQKIEHIPRKDFL
ncbi:putative disease resistance protein RGA3 isoform X1 [Triticum dicoccoides]|uniref:putative disease resistance protein RGA3 isoform X1 n=2 Tax=Triticum dicoccoides TaxID=85692 RepID=UPI0018901A2F|nr:putative disease resistance protein RGA3 isoform X1 [Triticum dicoccoides]XP_037445373.1 putative disease resistance protein RGA3 isoform X1 [Triticum dicoccoides]